MVDAMRSTRTSRKLAGLKEQCTGESSSGTMGEMTPTPTVIEKEGITGEVYMPY